MGTLHEKSKVVSTLEAGEQMAQFVTEPRLFQEFFSSRAEQFKGTLNIQVVEGEEVSAISFLQDRSSGALVTIQMGINAYGGD